MQRGLQYLVCKCVRLSVCYHVFCDYVQRDNKTAIPTGSSLHTGLILKKAIFPYKLGLTTVIQHCGYSRSYWSMKRLSIRDIPTWAAVIYFTSQNMENRKSLIGYIHSLTRTVMLNSAPQSWIKAQSLSLEHRVQDLRMYCASLLSISDTYVCSSQVKFGRSIAQFSI